MERVLRIVCELRELPEVEADVVFGHISPRHTPGSRVGVAVVEAALLEMVFSFCFVLKPLLARRGLTLVRSPGAGAGV